MVSAKSLAIACVALFLGALAGCGAKPPAPARGGDTASQETSDLTPPRVDTVRADATGVVLSGSAPANAKVRLASPGGEASSSTADAKGRWTMRLPPAVEARILGLSVTAGARQAQAEGYVLVTPAGQAALLRAGAGALRIDPPSRPGLRAIDFDRGGGLEVSVSTPPGATVIVHLDGHQVAEGRADSAGRYQVSLGSPNPIRPGRHEIQVYGDGFEDRAEAQISPAAPLAQGPVRSQLTPAGLRVDWMTPGGGEQSTLFVH